MSSVPSLLLAASDSIGRIDALISRLQFLLHQPHTGLIARTLVLLACGALGIYLMLPRGQRSGRRLERYAGGALATLSLVLLVTIPISAAFSGGGSVSDSQSTVLWELNDQPAAACYTFHILAFVSLASAVMMITSRNPVYSALWFAMVLLGNSGLYLLQGAEFLSAATIIVYAGAIVVTFLFVIMLAQPEGAARYDRYSREPLLAGITGLILASALVGTLHYTARLELRGGTTEIAVLPAPELIAEQTAMPGDTHLHNPNEHVLGLGRALFLDHVVSVEVIGLLLLAAVVGAMLIAGHKVEQPGSP
jgi:NADH-quinone oxidoreductase subunit J